MLSSLLRCFLGMGNGKWGVGSGGSGGVGEDEEDLEASVSQVSQVSQVSPLPTPHSPLPIKNIYKGLSLTSGIHHIGAYNNHQEVQNTNIRG